MYRNGSNNRSSAKQVSLTFPYKQHINKYQETNEYRKFSIKHPDAYLLCESLRGRGCLCAQDGNSSWAVFQARCLLNLVQNRFSKKQILILNSNKN